MFRFSAEVFQARRLPARPAVRLFIGFAVSDGENWDRRSWRRFFPYSVVHDQNQQQENRRRAFQLRSAGGWLYWTGWEWPSRHAFWSWDFCHLSARWVSVFSPNAGRLGSLRPAGFLFHLFGRNYLTNMWASRLPRRFFHMWLGRLMVGAALKWAGRAEDFVAFPFDLFSKFQGFLLCKKLCRRRNSTSDFFFAAYKPSALPRHSWKITRRRVS